MKKNLLFKSIVLIVLLVLPFVSSAQSEEEPLMLTLADLVAEEPAAMEGMLVSIADVMFEPDDEMMTAFEPNTYIPFLDVAGLESETFDMALCYIPDDSELVGVPLPDDLVTLTGVVSYSEVDGMFVVTPRSLDDLGGGPGNVDPGIRTTGNPDGYAGWGIVGGPLQTDYMIQLEGGVEQDITISCDYDGVTFEPQIITPADAAAGIGIQFKLMVRKEGRDSTFVTFTSGDIQHVDSIKWTGSAPDLTGTIAECRADTANKAFFVNTYKFATQAQVVYVTPGVVGGYDYYVQDETGGVILNDWQAEVAGYRAGDVVDGFYGSFVKGGGLDKGMLWMRVNHSPEPIDQTTEFYQTAVTVADLLANPFDYESRVVKLENVTLTLPEGKTKFEKNMNVELVQGEAKATLKVLPETDLIGRDIPTGALTVKGLSVSSSGRFIAPLSMADIEPASGIGSIYDDMQLALWCEGATVIVRADGLLGMEVYTFTGVKVAAVSGVDSIELPAGAYLLKVNTVAGTVVRKVIVQ